MARVKGSGNSRFVGRVTFTSATKEMRRFDKLPPEVREALRSCRGDVSTEGLIEVCRKFPVAEVVVALRVEDLRSTEDFIVAEFGREAVAVLLGEEG